MWQKVLFALVLANLSASQENCDISGTLLPDYWQTQSDTFAISGCPGSYFQVNILPLESDVESNYNLVIEDLARIENENITQDILLATLDENLLISVRQSDFAANFSIPFTIDYFEVANSSSLFEPGLQENATIEEDNIQPNRINSYFLTGHGKVHRMDLTWSIPDASAILALRRDNGRITLFTNPVAENLKV